MSNQITSFPFWTPVYLPSNFISLQSNTLEMMYQIGLWADQYASLSWEEWNISYIKMNGNKYDLKLKNKTDVDHTLLTLKAITYISSLFILPAIALAIKYVFKKFLNELLINSAQIESNEVIMARKVGNIKVLLLTGDLLNEKTDIIVNPANKSLQALGGVCGIIHRKSGDEPFDDCEWLLTQKKKKAIEPGEAVITTSGNLSPQIKAIIHTPGPDCNVKEENEKRRVYLKNSYTNALKLASDPKTYPNDASIIRTIPYQSISFVSISTGIFNYPLKNAARVAAEAVQNFITQNPKSSLKEIRFVFLKNEPDTIDAYKNAFSKIGTEIVLPKKQKGKLSNSSNLNGKTISSNGQKPQPKPAETKKSDVDKKAVDSNKDRNITAAVGAEKDRPESTPRKKSDAQKETPVSEPKPLDPNQKTLFEKDATKHESVNADSSK